MHRHPAPSRPASIRSRGAAWLPLAGLMALAGLTGCQTIHDAQLLLPPDIAPVAQRCEIQTEAGWGGSTWRTCGHTLKSVGWTTTSTSGSNWDLGLAGSKSTEKRTRFRYQFTPSGQAMQEWHCDRLENDRLRHVARVLWKSEYEGSVTCHTPAPDGEERFTFDTRYPDRVTWFKGEAAQTWRLVPQQQWQGGGRVMDMPMPMGWCAYDEQGQPVGCHDWVSRGGAVWSVPQAQAVNLRRLAQLALSPQQLWSPQ